MTQNTLTNIKRDLASLTLQEKERLLACLVEDLDNAKLSDNDLLWVREIEKRNRHYEMNPDSAIPAELFFDQINV